MTDRRKAKRNPKLSKVNQSETAFLDAAELMFGEHGYSGTSMRAVAEKANANLGAINYYFGSKEVLMKKVLERSMKTANLERLEKLRTYKQEFTNQAPDFMLLLRAFIEPLFAIHKVNPVFDKMVLRTINDPAPQVQKIFGEFFAESSALFIELSIKCNPSLTMEESYWRLNCVMAGLVQMLVARSDLVLASGGKFSFKNEDQGLELVMLNLYRLFMAPPDMPAVNLEQCEDSKASITPE
tara:strand:+ start:144635 stop:145354 length:720 start_codon:yes stop_codon:yes gene_type:complete